jgi:hypothetical protein
MSAYHKHSSLLLRSVNEKIMYYEIGSSPFFRWKFYFELEIETTNVWVKIYDEIFRQFHSKFNKKKCAKSLVN